VNLTTVILQYNAQSIHKKTIHTLPFISMGSVL